MNMKNIVYEENLTVNHLSGRDLRWYFTPDMKLSESFSMNVVEIKPGCTVSPAHSHPEKEELIYVVCGEGSAYVDGEVYPVHSGTAVLFRRGSVHMLRNVGDTVMKVVCFFTPEATMEDYRYHEEASFPE